MLCSIPNLVTPIPKDVSKISISVINCFVTCRGEREAVNQEKLAGFRKDVESLLNTVASQHPALSFGSKVKKLF